MLVDVTTNVLGLRKGPREGRVHASRPGQKCARPRAVQGGWRPRRSGVILPLLTPRPRGFPGASEPAALDSRSEHSLHVAGPGWVSALTSPEEQGGSQGVHA